jgi:putative peptidoglycan lipid II flippase
MASLETMEEKMSKVKLARAAGIIMIVTLISKAIGFLRDALIAGSFGATYLTDAYNMSITVSEILFAVFSLAITTTFIPILSDIYKNKSKDEMFRFANNIMNILLLISIVLGFLGWTFAEQLVRVIAPRFTGETYELTVRLTRLSVVSIIFMSMNGGYTAVLQTLDDFMAPALVGMMLNLPIIAYILSGARAGVIGLAAATVVGNGLKVAVQIPWLLKHGYRYSLGLDFKDSRLRKLITLIMPVLIGAGANQLNAVIDKIIGSGLPPGSISALNFSSRITDVVYVTFATAIVTVVYPALSRESTSDNYDMFKFYIVKAVNNISLIMIPCMVGLIVLSTPVITLLFKHGVFDDRAVKMTVAGLIFYSVGIPFYGVRDVFNRSLYAMKDTKTSTKNGLFGIAVNITFNLLLVGFMGLGGLALATSIAAITTTFLLFRSLVKKIGHINGRQIVATNLKIAFSALIMGFFVHIIYNFSSDLLSGRLGVLAALLISVAAGVLVYALMLLLFRIEEFTLMLSKLSNRIKRTSNS